MTYLNSSKNLILALDQGGIPRKWITFEDAITYWAKDQVMWEAGEQKFLARGGYQLNGEQSLIETSSIIAIRGPGFDVFSKNIPLTNRLLFGRDQNICAYCGRSFTHHKLSRDHIIPRSRGGADTWMNTVTACRDCNCFKDNMTPEEADMPILYIPYIPSYHEKMIMENRNILADQMEFLKKGVPKHSRILMN